MGSTDDSERWPNHTTSKDTSEQLALCVYIYMYTNVYYYLGHVAIACPVNIQEGVSAKS